MKLSILICTLPKRNEMLSKLVSNIWNQVTSNYFEQVEILYERSDVLSIGAKRNMLLSNATGEYICFIDDDDEISDSYIRLLMEGINKGVDCCSLKGIYSVDGVVIKPFYHYLGCKEYSEDEIGYYRYPNHLNCIKASIAKRFKFPEINHGEDTDWATQIHNSGLIKTQHLIKEVIYYYNKRTK